MKSILTTCTQFFFQSISANLNSKTSKGIVDLISNYIQSCQIWENSSNKWTKYIHSIHIYIFLSESPETSNAVRLNGAHIKPKLDPTAGQIMAKFHHISILLVPNKCNVSMAATSAWTNRPPNYCSTCNFYFFSLSAGQFELNIKCKWF